MIITDDNAGELVFGADGLLPAVAQDVHSGEVLMLAWMNSSALQATLQRRRAVFWSRSRQRLWEKGETSGHTLELVACHADCDRDTLLLLVVPRGPACHTGTLTCFADGPLTHAGRLGFVAELETIIAGRIDAARQLESGGASEPAKSYTARLYAEGPKRIAQKVGEEGVETALAAVAGSDSELLSEAADLVYHLTVCLQARGLTLADVAAELRRRHVRSG
ncbi:MAG: bifunctional phosphoribosyl-AMP cyclohydrolase/phosphoribosyl-ATP diphosphatase HisIE [Gammaproteobacteria bacterium]|nr:bifunctional phosphoribosyl-AMP cyclohydrolase/phosphoribosyl-ATP diphosphatase HisIE [Gammaproteobacteria bacterium]